MKWKTTWLLLGVAGVLFAFIWFVERHSKATSLLSEPPPRLIHLRAAEVTNVLVRRTNQIILRAARGEQGWTLTLPFSYPAQTYAIETLLQHVEILSTSTHISMDELAANKRTVADFGLDVPLATLSLSHEGRRTELLFGAKTAVGDQVYLQSLHLPGIYLVNADVFDLIPRSVTDWRDTALLNLAGVVFDRIEVRSASRGFAIHADHTNDAFYLSKPTPARAARAQVEALLRTILTNTVSQFVTDNPRAELEPYGLQPPEAELVFGRGTNDLVTVQFGKSPTNDPTTVYARRSTHGNVVLVSRDLLEVLQTSHTELRDRRLLAFTPDAVEAIEVVGAENFSVRRLTNGTWTVGDNLPADPELMREWLGRLGRLEGSVEKDVVTDFASYGLAEPIRQYLLKGSATNAAGAITNRLLARLDIGGRQDDRLFARGVDENTVYTISRRDYSQLPSSPWQLRDRRVWSFTTNQVRSVTVSKHGRSRVLLRSGAGEWTVAPGSSGIITTEAVEETMFRLGQLRAATWVARGAENRLLYGFSDDAYRLTIELKGGDKAQVLNLELGDKAPSQQTYAAATVDGQAWVFEFPSPLDLLLLRDLPPPAPAPSP
jgi:hypothetical protein